MSKVRIELNRATARGILRGELAPGVTAKLLAMGSAIGAAAEAASEEGAEFSVRSHVGANRFRVTVGTANQKARMAEATNRTLTLALNAGRQ